MSNKRSEAKEVTFSNDDFNRDYPNRYVIVNNDLIITYHTGEKWEFSETFKKESENHYTNEGKSLKFVPWEPE